MSEPTHSNDASPFHHGELAIQDRLGLRETMHRFASRVVRDHMPQQHREFYGSLPHLLIGSLDNDGQPWASMLVGPPGFISAPDDKTLRVNTVPLFGDPLGENLKDGTPLGLLGIELHTRRRNRMNGKVHALKDGTFDIAVDQSFGNCPKYIQARDFELLESAAAAATQRPLHKATTLDAAAKAIIAKADTLFIASAYIGNAENGENTRSTGNTEYTNDPRHGVDVSHRGGKPGFVHLEDNGSFIFPDFTGNNHFNTFGNISLNPKTGFLFPDFVTGDMLYLTGEAEIIWDGPLLAAFKGAERLLRFTAKKVIRVENSLPFRWKFRDYAPNLANLGSWDDTFAAIDRDKNRNSWRRFQISHRQRESATITSFHLRPEDGQPVAPHQPGQYLPIRLTIPGEKAPTTRTYTISDISDGSGYRLSVKRENHGLASQYLHDQMPTGTTLEAMAPRGKFTLNEESNRPVVLLSAGVGITPMMAMANKLLRLQDPNKDPRPVHFFHGARSGQDHAFGDAVRQLSKTSSNLTAHIRYSQPASGDSLGVHYDSVGRIDMAFLKSHLGLDDYDFYLCGPAAFMQALYRGLAEIGVTADRIHYESFGPAAVLDAPAPAPEAETSPTTSPVKVTFAKSGKEAVWAHDKGTLLEFAEAQGLTPDFSCRGGVCGSCATKVLSGHVDYIDDPIGNVAEDEALICCSTPRAVKDNATCGKDCGLVLDL